MALPYIHYCFKENWIIRYGSPGLKCKWGTLAGRVAEHTMQCYSPCTRKLQMLKIKNKKVAA